MTVGYAVQPRFITGTAGDLFILEIIPNGKIVGSVLIAPPFAEEMNRSRRMLSLQARQLASQGYRALVPDLFGTGDSAGDFADARWEIWRQDLATVVEETNFGDDGPASILGLRLGALLAMDVLARNEVGVDRLVLWNPCVSGKQFMTQFLRMRVMANMIGKAPENETTANLRQFAQQGNCLEVAGYTLAPDLVSCIDSLNMTDLAASLTVPIVWFEVVGAEGRPFPVNSNRIADDLVSCGCRIEKKIVSGPQFWATPEIAVSPDLLSATAMLFNGA